MRSLRQVQGACALLACVLVAGCGKDGSDVTMPPSSDPTIGQPSTAKPRDPNSPDGGRGGGPPMGGKSPMAGKGG